MHAQRTPTPFMYRVVAAVVRPLMRALTRYEVTGLEHLPTSGGFIVTPNHLSHVDVFTWGHVLYNEGFAPIFLAKSSLFRTPVVASIMRHTHQVPVERESGSAATSLVPAMRAIEAGKCLAIYPEGSLTRDPDLWPMRGKTGAARLALDIGCPVIPIVTWGPQDLLAPYSKRLHLLPPRTRIHIRFGPPVLLDDLRASETRGAAIRTATDRIMAAMTHELEQVRDERAPTERFDPKAHGLRSTGNYHAGGNS